MTARPSTLECVRLLRAGFSPSAIRLTVSPEQWAEISAVEKAEKLKSY